MSKVSEGKKVPKFSAQAADGEPLSLSDLAGQKVVLYFYPKDNTPGCTTESVEFNSNLAKFKRRNAVVVGVSRDSVASHCKFIDKYGFKFPLLSDPDEKLCQLFDVIKMKKMYGKDVRGIERSTFLIDEAGILKKAWRGVKVKGHVEEVLAAVAELDKP